MVVDAWIEGIDNDWRAVGRCGRLRAFWRANYDPAFDCRRGLADVEPARR